jgi:fructan beta-fructosidase
MRIYSSPDLKSWAYESSFGKDQGAHGGVWECPDLFEVPVEGTKNSKWVLVCNINPGGPFGGSATQYFVGTFDGKQFINDSPSVTKWMDYGKDHYATVTWSDAPNNRRVGLAWMSNWQYANEVPTLQFRSANSVPRDYTLFTNGGDTWLKSAPVPELDALRRESSKPQTITVSATRTVAPLPIPATGTCEITLTLRERTGVLTFSLTNDKGEAVLCKIDRSAGTFSMDRTRSGKVDFHKEFAATTVAPLENGTLTLRLLIDKSSIEVFGNGGRFAMTNLVFPSEPYNALTFQAEKGTFRVRDIVISKLEL